MNTSNAVVSKYKLDASLRTFMNGFCWCIEQGVKVCKSKIKNISISYLQLEYDKRYENLEEIYYYIMK